MENKKIDFVFAIHNHQPVGNFDFVIEQNYRDAYEPFLSALEKYPNIRLGMHYTGYLWEYINNEHPDFVERLKVLIERDQIEILGGAYYEPIISVLPERDAQIQLSSYKSLMSDYSGCEVNGMWLAERVWEPVMPTILKKSGYSYTFLDESHFHAAGVHPDDIWGYFISEDRSAEVKIFPIDKKLRYIIPFETADKILHELERRLDQGVELITYGDDGEKFGGWPGTKKWVYDDGWLESFLKGLQDNEAVNMILPREAIAKYQARGLVYIPCASYEEMGEWTLSPKTQVELHHLKTELDEVGLSEQVQPLIRGGFWRQFLAKYPEAKRMYRRMYRVSDKVANLERRKREAAEEARTALMRGQANDAFWHGVFGGIYLPHLRFAVLREMIKAETICDRENKFRRQADKHEPDSLTLENQFLRIQIAPNHGGGAASIDVRQAGINLADTITRQFEAYHARLSDSPPADNGSHKSIHDRLEFKEDNLAEKLTYDKHQRICFIDRFFKADGTVEDTAYNRNAETGDFADSRYDIFNCDKMELTLQRAGQVDEEDVIINKNFRLSKNEMELRVEYEIIGELDRLKDILFAPELNIDFMAPNADDRFFLLDGERFAGNNLGSWGDRREAQTLSLVDDYLGVRVNLTAESRVQWIWYPVETISLSEGGVERIYQGSGIHPLWKLSELEEKKTAITMTVECWKPII